MGILDRILRAGEGKKLKALQGIVPDINRLEPSMEALSDAQLAAKTGEFRQRLARGETLDDLLDEAFATVREAARRVIGQRHYDVQLMGGAALHFGWVAEMKTGEGKTLVSTLPAYLNALGGKGVHLVTVNDYLARRDSEWMGQIHRFLGLDIGLVIPGLNTAPNEKRAQYACDITHGTNNEFGFDYLRDNMAAKLVDKTQRGHNFAIVDEVDSILIDEARTPLIISGRVADAAKLYYRFASIVRSLRRDEHYEVEEDKRVVVPLEGGIEAVEQALGIDNLYDEVQQNLVHQLQSALKAKELYKRDKDYIVSGGEVKIVDEFTGRILEGRRWSEGIHQAVEAKEGVKIKEENQTLATVTLQNYFRMYDKLAGMTGTAMSEAAELMNTYELGVVPIPTNRDMVRADQADLIFKSEVAKFDAVVDDIAERHDAGQPILVGTVSVEKSEYLARQLDRRGIAHEVLNAKQHTREAGIVAQAGRIGSVTVATNMAGRGVDIVLGGNPEALAEEAVVREGHDPAMLVADYALPVPADQMSDDDKAARRAALARYEELLAEYRAECTDEGDQVRKVGGLYVIGSERHESRRIDNQLRGRSGRQGDPGESRFYLSLDDELMRLFATGALSWAMNRALPDDEAIEAKMVTKAIERAQTTVETRNAEIRKNLLKYDEVMNEQRKVIYARRDQILEGTDLKSAALEYVSDAVDALLDTHCASAAEDEWDLDGLARELTTFWPTTVSADELDGTGSTKKIRALILDDAEEHYARREAELTPKVMREVERQVMLRIIDQRWREHLEEMDYLREGINLRAMGQKDPVTEWQRDGYEMFGALMKGIAQDFVRYVMHVQVVRQQEQPAATPTVTSGPSDDPQSPQPSLAAATPAAMAGGAAHPARPASGARPAAEPRPMPATRQAQRPAVQNLQTSSSETNQTSALGRVQAEAQANAAAAGHAPGAVSPVAKAVASRLRAGQAGGAGRAGRSGGGTVARGDSSRRTGAKQVPTKTSTVVKDEWDKTPRNAPCPCGSGKKYKLCHGAN